MAREQCAEGVNDWQFLLQQLRSHVVNDRELQYYRPKKYQKRRGEDVGGAHVAGSLRLDVRRLRCCKGGILLGDCRDPTA